MLKAILETGKTIAKAVKTKSVGDVIKATGKTIKLVEKVGHATNPKKERKCTQKMEAAGKCKVSRRSS